MLEAQILACIHMLKDMGAENSTKFFISKGHITDVTVLIVTQGTGTAIHV